MATKKPKAKAKASVSTPRRVTRKPTAATSPYTQFESNGIITFCILAIIFLVIAAMKYM